MTEYFLKPNTLAEPLIHRWYAWPMLVSPATGALIQLKSHLSILRSYLQMPKMHEAAVRNPAMRGGPFMDFDGQDRVEDVDAFLSQLQNNPLIALACGLVALNQMLIEKADGHSLSPLYANIPDILKGYVELVYDINNRASYRVIEALLYRSRFYDETAQAIMLSPLQGDHRSFVLSTPRLGDEAGLLWNIDFKNSEVDVLFSSRNKPLEKNQLLTFFTNNFEDTEVNSKQFLSLFTEKKLIEKPERYEGDDVRIRYFGHACVLVESKQTSILIDPMISYGYETTINRFTYEDLPEQIDYVLLTHSHQDHVVLEHLLQLRHKIGTLVVPKNASGMIQDPSLKLMFKQLGFKQVIELDELESIDLPNGEITGLPFFGEHGDLYIQSKMAYVVRIQHKTLFFAADSDNIEPTLYEHLQQDIPAFDMIFLGMECEGAPVSWLYGSIFDKPLSRTMDQSRRLNGSNCERAMDIIRRFDCQQVYIYAMGQEPWLGYITSIEYTPKSYPMVESNQLIAACIAEGRTAKRLFLQHEMRLDCE